MGFKPQHSQMSYPGPAAEGRRGRLKNVQLSAMQPTVAFTNSTGTSPR